MIEIRVVRNVISKNFYSNHEAAQLNQTELFFLNLMNKLKIMIFNFMAILPHFQMLHLPNCKVEVLRRQKQLTDLIFKVVHTTPLPPATGLYSGLYKYFYY